MTIKIALLTVIMCAACTQLTAQKKFSSYLQAQVTGTVYDYTRGNNPFAAGLGLQTYFNTRSNFKLVLDITGDAYLGGDKVLRLNPDQTPADDVSGVLNVFVGASFHPSEKIYFAYLSGVSVINGKAYFGIRPSIGYYFSPSQKWTSRLYFTNVFNRNKQTTDDFGSLSLAIGLKLF